MHRKLLIIGWAQLSFYKLLQISTVNRGNYCRRNKLWLWIGCAREKSDCKRKSTSKQSVTSTCSAPMDFTYIKRNNCASEMQPTNAQCEILQETTEETSLNTNKWFSWSNNSENPVNWSNSGFRPKLCARHDFYSITKVLLWYCVCRQYSNSISLKWKEKKVYLKASHFKRRQWR